MVTASSFVLGYGFGHPECWSDGLSFIGCCSVGVHGASGNLDCWSGNRTFEQCCFDDPGSNEKMLNLAMVAVEHARADFIACVSLLAELLHIVDVERVVYGGERFLRPAETMLLTLLPGFLSSWRREHLLELLAQLPQILAAYEEEHRIVQTGLNNDRLARRNLRIAVLIACTPISAGSDSCRLGVNLWQCYAERHGYHVIFDTNQYPPHPDRFRFEAALPQGSLPTALDDPFEARHLRFLERDSFFRSSRDSSPNERWWQRWYAARRHFMAYDLLLVVDADTAVHPACQGVDLLTAFGLSDDPALWPGVIVRDPRVGEDVNGGVIALTRSPWGRLYLDLLLARSRWPLDAAGGGGWCHALQAAEAETLLEVMALSRAVNTGKPLLYSSECIQHAVPQVSYFERGKPASAACIWPWYLRCWHAATLGLVGPSGDRWDSAVRFVNPEIADINYRPWSNEPRYRKPFINTSDDLPAIARTAFLWHYVALPNKVDGMLRDFGISMFGDSFDCDHLRKRGDTAGACELAGSAHPCPFDDSVAMPLLFGC